MDVSGSKRALGDSRWRRAWAGSDIVEALDLDRPEADVIELAWSSDTPLSRDEEASETRDLDDFFDLLDETDA